MHSTRNYLATQGGRKKPQTTKDRTFRTFLLMAQLDAEGISARIREARLEAGLTQEQLADLLHVHKKTVENYEHGGVNYRTLNQLAAILNKPVEWLLHGNETELSPDRLEGLAERVEAVLVEVRALREIVEPLVEAQRQATEGTPQDPRAT